MGMIIIGLANIKVDCIIGCHYEERLKPRRIFLDLKLKTASPSTDVLEHTVNYERVAQYVEIVAKEGQFHLLEVLVVEVVERILLEFPTVLSVWIKAIKPHAIPQAESCFVEYEKDRS
ncbi:MAG: hypothetical protein JWO53_1299 [Chlamydiia bacterium]|nr:hypothetical protein [Chlamydiia bacterium]